LNPAAQLAKRPDRTHPIMSYGIMGGFGLSLLALALNLAGVWKGAADAAAALCGLTLVLALLSIMNDSDKSAR
jgi:hypothetical protein